jgi:hypothetical protein
MFQTPPEISRLVETQSANRGVPTEERALYQKWPHFNLDFCDKKRLDPLDKVDLSSFDHK